MTMNIVTYMRLWVRERVATCTHMTRKVQLPMHHAYGQGLNPSRGFDVRQICPELKKDL